MVGMLASNEKEDLLDSDRHTPKPENLYLLFLV